jgi:hypothetical protein
LALQYHQLQEVNFPPNSSWNVLASWKSHAIQSLDFIIGSYSIEWMKLLRWLSPDLHIIGMVKKNRPWLGHMYDAGQLNFCYLQIFNGP